MDSAQNHLESQQLEQGLSEVRNSPQDDCRLEAIFIRPQPNERQSLDSAKLSPGGGIEGDRWAVDHWQKLPDGSPDPVSQVSLMNARILRLIAGDEKEMGLAGDNLIVDLDLSEANLPAGSQLKIGDSVVLEFTTQPHTGCGKFSKRYGAAALEFVNGPIGKPLNFRGRYARVVQSGTIQRGDSVKKC